MKPTIKDLMYIVENYIPQYAAEEIVKLYEPKLKPLSEIHKSKEHCKLIFEFITNTEYSTHSQMKTHNNEYLQISGFDKNNKLCQLFIYVNGLVELKYDKKNICLSNVFFIVKIINSLGYNAITND